MRKTASRLVKPIITYGAIVGRVIENDRRGAGVDQGTIAKALRISQSAYSRLEQGQSAMTLAQLRTVAEVLGRTPGDILREADALTSRLRSQGVEISEEKNVPHGAILVALGILSTILSTNK